MIKVKNAFKKMDYEEALESNIESLEWITEHNGQFGHFIGGRFTKPKNLFKTINPFNKKEIAKMLGDVQKTPEWEAVRKRNAWVNIYNPDKKFVKFLQTQTKEMTALMKKLGVI